jgi:hypothetical protein
MRVPKVLGKIQRRKKKAWYNIPIWT